MVKAKKLKKAVGKTKSKSKVKAKVVKAKSKGKVGRPKKVKKK